MIGQVNINLSIEKLRAVISIYYCQFCSNLTEVLEIKIILKLQIIKFAGKIRFFFRHSFSFHKIMIIG